MQLKDATPIFSGKTLDSYWCQIGVEIVKSLAWRRFLDRIIESANLMIFFERKTNLERAECESTRSHLGFRLSPNWGSSSTHRPQYSRPGQLLAMFPDTTVAIEDKIHQHWIFLAVLLTSAGLGLYLMPFLCFILLSSNHINLDTPTTSRSLSIPSYNHVESHSDDYRLRVFIFSWVQGRAC